MNSESSPLVDENGVYSTDRDRLLPNVKRQISLDSNATTQSEKDEQDEDDNDENKHSAYVLSLRLLNYANEQWLLYTIGFVFLLCYSLGRIFMQTSFDLIISQNIFLYYSRSIHSVLHWSGDCECRTGRGARQAHAFNPVRARTVAGQVGKVAFITST
jgi:hypothetical protein